MAQLFSSGVTPEYLKAMADAYAMYFPQQQTYNPQTQQTTTGTLTPEYQQALQQWYGAASSAPTAVVPQSVVGGLFEDLYPQTRGGGGGSRGGYVDSNPAWTNMTDAEKANYYANNPTMASITQTLQNLWGNTSLGMLQNKFDPEGVANQRAIAMGVTPNPQGTLAGVPIVNQVVDPMQAAQAAAIAREYESRGNVGGDFGGNSPGYGDTGMRDSTGYDSGRTGTSF